MVEVGWGEGYMFSIIVESLTFIDGDASQSFQTCEPLFMQRLHSF